MNIIVAVDKNWSIGKNGQLLVSIPADQKLFRQETMGKVVVMGRKTLESLPGGQPLPGRTTIVLSRNSDYRVKNALVCHSVSETLETLKGWNQDDVFIAGGQQIYEAFLPYGHTAHVTYIDYAYEADTGFPNLDREEGWDLDLETEEETYFSLCYTFRRYVKCSNLRGS